LARAARSLKVFRGVSAEPTFGVAILFFSRGAERHHAFDERADGEGRGHDRGRAARRVEGAPLPVEVVAPSAVAARTSDARVEKIARTRKPSPTLRASPPRYNTATSAARTRVVWLAARAEIFFRAGRSLRLVFDADSLAHSVDGLGLRLVVGADEHLGEQA